MRKISLSILAMGLFLASCTKTTTPVTTPTPTTTTATAPPPSFATGDGYLVALKTITTTTVVGIPVETVLGTAASGFGSMSAQTFVDAGSVTVNSNSLTKSTNNAYYFQPSTTNPTGLDFSNGINWTIGGNANVTGFSHNATSQGFPSTTDFATSFTTVSASSDFTLSTSSAISNADSVYFQLSGPSGNLIKRMSGSSTSATFTASEIQTLGKGYGSVVIAPWNHTVATYNSKTYHVVNETAIARIIEIN